MHAVLCRSDPWSGAALVRHANEVGLYSNLITSGVLLDRTRLGELVAAGLEHVQISFQDTEAASADRIAGLPQAHEKKLAVAALVREQVIHAGHDLSVS